MSSVLLRCTWKKGKGRKCGARERLAVAHIPMCPSHSQACSGGITCHTMLTFNIWLQEMPYQPDQTNPSSPVDGYLPISASYLWHIPPITHTWTPKSNQGKILAKMGQISKGAAVIFYSSKYITEVYLDISLNRSVPSSRLGTGSSSHLKRVLGMKLGSSFFIGITGQASFHWPLLSASAMIWPNLTWPDTTWPDLTSSPGLAWPDLTWPDLSSLIWPYLTLPDLTWPNLTWPDLTYPDLTWP